MTIYTVYWKENNEKQCETVYSLSEAKKIMKAHPGSTGDKTKVYSNGDWVPCGPITLKGSNKTFVANTKMTKSNY
jgi:hypothetical protein